MANNKYNPTYKITNDSTLFNKKYGITPQIDKAIQSAHKQALSGNISNEKKIQDLIAKYPHIPHFKNYLSGLYEKSGKREKANEITNKIISEHPDYLFGKINLAGKHLAEGNLDKIPDILGKELKLDALYPERDTFHISEVISFYNVVARYYLKKEDIEGIKDCSDYLEEISVASNTEDKVDDILTLCRMKLAISRMEKEKEQRIEVKVMSDAELSSIDNLQAPVFANPGISQLYINDMHIKRDILRDLLALPRESIIADLEKVLMDSIERFAYFSRRNEDEPCDFPIHAMFLLGELKAIDSLPVVFKVLSQHRAYYDNYFGDMLSEAIWEPVYFIANTKLNELKDFILQPGKYTYAKTMLFRVVDQVAMQEPDRRGEVIEWYQYLCVAFNKCSLEDNIIDSDLLGLMVWHFVDLAGKDALIHVKPLFDKGWVNEFSCGTYEDLEKEDLKPKTKKEALLDIVSRYDQIVNTRASYNKNKTPGFSGAELFDKSFSQPVVKDKKVGRNDPCPCGSGKKYKKCCMGKDS